MTTPAVNINETIMRNSFISFTPESGSDVPDTPITFPGKFISKVRPASSTVPIVGDWRPCRGWSHSGFHWEVPFGTARRRYRSSFLNGTYLFPDGSFWSVARPGVPSFPSSGVNQAEQKALTKLRNTDFNLGVALAEGRQTLNLVARSALKIASQVRKFRRIYPKEWQGVVRWQRGFLPCDLWKNIPGRWLELQYGWKPLMSDIVGAYSLLSEKPRPPVVHVDGYWEDDRGDLLVPIGCRQGGSTATMVFGTKDQAWVNLWYRLNSPMLAKLSSLGLLNPLEIVWERLPYSFVVDWFLPIGSALANLTSDVGFSFLGGSLSRKTTVKNKQSRNVVWENVIGPGVTILEASGPPPSISGEAFRFTRTCYSSSPVPGIYVKNPLSFGHVANGLSLLSQAFR